MRITVLLALMIFTTALKAQTFRDGQFIGGSYRSPFAYAGYPADSGSQKKWYVTRYSALSASYTFFKGGQAQIVAVPVGLQVTRRLTNNLYAFGNATIVPAHVSFNRSFINNGSIKAVGNNGPFKSSGLDVYSSASLGLQYVNDERTFSISGSIGVQRSSYPFLPYYRTNEQLPPSPRANR
ncbi:MAG TPA: hypothetical protein VM884_03185 [Flavisolibacter sp.]|nr:hypothetical protein [Flavisolibacter sp.]